jgi:hypothetical protein
MLNCIIATTLPKSGMKRPSTPGLVHAAQVERRIAARRQDIHEQPVGLRIGAQRLVDQLQRAPYPLQRVRMEVEPVAIGEPEHPDDVDRILLEHVLVGNVDTLVLDDEIVRTLDFLRPPREGQGLQEPVECRRLLDLFLLQRRADDARQVADILGDQEVVLHEALDILQPGWLL